MADIKLPYVRWRDGRPRFHPSARELALGFQGEDLRHPGGAWYCLDEARAWSAARHAEIVAARVSGRRQRPAAPARGDTVEDLLEDWLHALAQETDEALSPDSIESYRKAANAVIYQPETRPERKTRIARERAAQTLGQEAPARPRERFAMTAIGAIGKIELNDFFGYAKRTRGHHMARSMVAAFSAAYTWGGLQPRWRLGANPRHALDLPVPEGRIVIYLDHELRALIAAADALGRGSIGDSIVLGVMTSQRQRDRLWLRDEGLVEGRHLFRQSKTNKLVAVKEAPQLRARLEQARARVAAVKLAFGTRPETVVVDETTGLPYVQDTYRHVFGAVRALAEQGSNEFALAPCPSLAGKRDQDLRDTSVTWLARAGCTMPEICAITGHSAKSVQTIIDHYLGAAAELADAGIDKLVAWMQREGVAV
jgi:hypothetical protein